MISYDVISYNFVLIFGALDIMCKKEEESYSKQYNVYEHIHQ